MGLSGISVGLGARLPNLRETDPSKIAVGFGGHAQLAGQPGLHLRDRDGPGGPLSPLFPGPGASRRRRTLALPHGGFRFWLGVAIVVSLIIGAVGTIVPLRIGIKAFQRMEL